MNRFVYLFIFLIFTINKNNATAKILG